MSDKKIPVHVVLLSDSTGETAHNLCRAVMAQFDTLEHKIHVWTMIKHVDQIDQVMKTIQDSKRTLFIFTLVDKQLVKYVEKQCKNRKIAYFSVINPLLEYISQVFKVDINPKPGQQHNMNKEYFDRISAMEFTLSHDDGMGLHNIHNAEVILIGASRTSKTPTTVYLANRGIRAANIPFVHGIPLPKELDELSENVLVVGLTKDARQLSHIRRTRMSMINDKQKNSDYDDFQRVKQEVQACRVYCQSRNWEVIDVTHRSIEETAATVIQLLTIHRHQLSQN